MKNTRIVNIQALKDSFSLIKREYGKKEGQDKNVRIGHIGKRIKENLSLSVCRSSDLFDYYLSEYRGGIDRDHFGNVIIPPELVLKKARRK